MKRNMYVLILKQFCTFKKKNAAFRRQPHRSMKFRNPFGDNTDRVSYGQWQNITRAVGRKSSLIVPV